jgi:hypothetical protein
MEHATFTIGQLAPAGGVNASAVRYYQNDWSRNHGPANTLIARFPIAFYASARSSVPRTVGGSSSALYRVIGKECGSGLPSAIAPLAIVAIVSAG